MGLVQATLDAGEVDQTTGRGLSVRLKGRRDHPLLVRRSEIREPNRGAALLLVRAQVPVQGGMREPVQAEATRRKVYDMLSAEKMTVQGFHYPFPSVAHVEKTATGYQEIPMLWNPVL